MRHDWGSGAGGLKMPIHRLLQNSAFQPEQIAELVTAYHAAVRDLQAADGVNSASKEEIAATVIEVAQTGVRDAAAIAEEAVARLRK
jgi:hypothetical protein